MIMKKRTVWKEDHPYNQMKAAGKLARKECQSKSNDDLDEYIRAGLGDGDELDRVLGLTRAKKIEYVGQMAESLFALQHNAKVLAEAEEQEEPDKPKEQEVLQ